MSTATGNIIIGKNCGDVSGFTGNNNVLIGQGSDPDTGSRQGAVVLGYEMGTAAADFSFRVMGTNGVFNTGNTTTWNQTSDRRIKKDIVDNQQGLDIIEAVRVRNFNYKTADEIAEASPELADLDLKDIAVDKSELQIGAIAQEIETVLPECVMTDDNGIKQVSTDRLIWHSIKAIQELSAKNAALEARIKTLEG